MAENSASKWDTKAVQVISIVIGFVISVLSFNHTRQKDADARRMEAESRAFELQKYYDQKKLKLPKRR